MEYAKEAQPWRDNFLESLDACSKPVCDGFKIQISLLLLKATFAEFVKFSHFSAG